MIQKWLFFSVCCRWRPLQANIIAPQSTHILLARLPLIHILLGSVPSESQRQTAQRCLACVSRTLRPSSFWRFADNVPVILRPSSSDPNRVGLSSALYFSSGIEQSSRDRTRASCARRWGSFRRSGLLRVVNCEYSSNQRHSWSRLECVTCGIYT